MNILIGLFGFIFIVLAWRRIDLATMLLLVALPSYLIRLTIFGVPLTLLEIMVLLLAFVWVWRFTEWRGYLFASGRVKKYLDNQKKRLPYPFRWEITLLLIISFGAVAVAGFSDSALGIWKAYFFEPMLFFIVILNLFQLPKEKERLTIDKIIISLAVSAFFVSVLAIYQKITGDLIFNPLWAAAETRRVVSFFGYPNAVGLYLAPLVIVMFGWFINQMRSNEKINISYRVLVIIVIMISLLSIYYAKSEGALVGLAVGLGFYILFLLFKNHTRIIAGLLFLLLALIIVSPLIYLRIVPPYKYFNSVNKIEDFVLTKLTLKDVSGEIRKQQWRETWQMLTSSPYRFILGAGLSGYQTAILPIHQPGIFYNFENDPDFRRKIVWFSEEYKMKHWQPVEIYMYPHNLFLNFWSELGLAGALLFAWIIGSFFYLGSKINDSGFKNNAFRLGLICAMIVIVVHGLVDVPYFKNDLAVMFWLLAALMSEQDLESDLNRINNS